MLNVVVTACVLVAPARALCAPHANGCEPPVTEPAGPAKPGEVLEMRLDPATGVCSAWLGNGVRVHHRAMRGPEQRGKVEGAQTVGGGSPGSVVVTIIVAGAELLETCANRGVSQGAAVAWHRPCARSFGAPEMDAYLAGAHVRLRGYAGADSMTLRVTAPRADIESGLRVARLLLTEPIVEPAAFEAWKQDWLQRATPFRRGGESVVHEALAGMMFAAEECRGRRPTTEAIGALGAPAAQAWLDAMLAPGEGGACEPIEAAIVGDISLDDAMKLAAVYLGSLPARPRISGATHAPQRAVKPSGAKMTGERAVPGWQGKSYVVAGCFGADIKELADHRALAVGAKVLAARMAANLPEAENVGGDATALSVPSGVYPGFGVVLGVTEVEPERAGDALGRVQHAIQSLCTNGPSAEELSKASGALAEGAAKMLKEPRYWSTMLATSEYRGVTPGEMGAAEKAYRSMTGGAVLAALKKYNVPERRIGLVVKGSGAEN